MKEEIKLETRKPTWNYILNDMALYSLLIKVIHSDSATNQEKFDLMYQVELLQSQLKAKEEVIKEAREVINKMINTGYFDGEFGYFATSNKSEFGVRAKIIDEILSKGENK